MPDENALALNCLRNGTKFLLRRCTRRSLSIGANKRFSCRHYSLGEYNKVGL